MLWFLRLFPQFRYLQESAANCTRLQDLNSSLQSQVTELQRQLGEAQENERTAYRAMVNMEVQPKYGFVMFPEAPHMPEGTDRPDLKPIRSNYVQGRDVAKRESAKALRQWADSQRS